VAGAGIIITVIKITSDISTIEPAYITPEDINDFLSVTGTTLSTNLTVTNLAKVGNLQLASNSIQSQCNSDELGQLEQVDISHCSSTLYLQPNGGSLNLLAGVLTISDSGLVAITGDLTVSGTVTANKLETGEISLTTDEGLLNSPDASISPRYPLIAASQNDDLEIKLASDSALIVSTETQDPVVKIGADGSARFNDLTLSAHASGLTTISAGDKVATLPAVALKTTSQVIVTFEGDYAPATKYWITKNFTDVIPTFTIHMDYPVASEVNASWLIIN